MSDAERLSMEELEAEAGTRLPDKEVVSLLDLFVNADLALDLAAPVDLAVAANANAAIPISGAVSANVLSLGSTAQAGSVQDGSITQYLSGDAIATAPQHAAIDQSNDTVDAGTAGAGDTAGAADTTATTDATAGTADGSTGDLTSTVGDPVVGTVGDTTGTVGDTVGGTTGTVGDTVGDTTGTVGDTTSGLVDGVTQSGVLDGNLLNVNVNVNLDTDMAAPVAGAVAANANVAAPVSAAVGANIGTVDSQALAVSNQSVDISQTMDGVTAQATADQSADITQ